MKVFVCLLALLAVANATFFNLKSEAAGAFGQSNGGGGNGGRVEHGGYRSAAPVQLVKVIHQQGGYAAGYNYQAPAAPSHQIYKVKVINQAPAPAPAHVKIIKIVHQQAAPQYVEAAPQIVNVVHQNVAPAPVHYARYEHGHSYASAPAQIIKVIHEKSIAPVHVSAPAPEARVVRVVHEHSAEANVQTVASLPLAQPAQITVPTSSYLPPSAGPVYSAPAPAPVYHAPAPVYQAPAPVYRAPAPVYSAPAPVYSAPAPIIRVPAPAPVHVPAQVYGPPAQSW